jgi:nitrous oxidase accessory protein NosD
MPTARLPRCAATGALSTILALAVMGAPAVGGGTRAGDLSCGEVITADTTLDDDLLDCPSNGIVIGADDITLDLNGHTVSGNGKPVARCPRAEFCDVGLLNDGHDGVTVRNGSVRGFGGGVFVGKARHNRVLHVSSSRNQFFGFVLAQSARTLVRGSSGSANPGPDGDGIAVFGSRHLRILENSFQRNSLGMHVEDSTDLVIARNRFAHNSGPGILMEADRNQVRGNRCVRNTDCILVAPGNRNVIARNRVYRGGGGIAIEKGRGNLVARNVIVRVRRVGIRLGIHRPPIGGAENVLRRNLVRASGDDGFLVTRNDRRSVLAANIAIGSGDDGFDVESASARLAGNRALRNADLGIQAASGAIDGGANTARHNGDRRQCAVIACS